MLKIKVDPKTIKTLIKWTSLGIAGIQAIAGESEKIRKDKMLADHDDLIKGLMERISKLEGKES